MTTALTNFLQTVGQRGVSAEKASLIYALDPVWGAIFATLILDERLGPYGYVGAGLITLAAAQNAIFALAKGKTEDDLLRRKIVLIARAARIRLAKEIQ